MAKMVWNEAAIRRLKACCEPYVDRYGDEIQPTLDDVLIAMDSTRPAIISAFHRFGLILGCVEIDEYGHSSTVTLRNCMSCAEVFGSRGKHNRLCRGCGGVGTGKRLKEREREREAA